LKAFLLKHAPALVAALIIVFVCALDLAQPRWVGSLEATTFDWRVRLARHYPAPVATNLGFVFINDESIARLNDPTHPLSCGLYWPRHIYGRVVDELAAQGARAVGLDVLLAQRRTDHFPVRVMGPGQPSAEEFLKRLQPDSPLTHVDGAVLIESDYYFAWQLRRTGTAVLAAEQEVVPAPLFATNAAAVGDVSADRDADGVLRRAWPFKEYRQWHPVLTKAAREYGIDLKQAQFSARELVLQPKDDQPVHIPLDADGCFDLTDLIGEKLPAGMARRAKPFTQERVWHMGIVLAAAQLGLNLRDARFAPDGHALVLSGTNGVQRTIPLDDDGRFYVDWNVGLTDPRLATEPFDSLLDQHLQRAAGVTEGLTNRWRDRLVLVGSSATGNDLTDRGSTPLQKDTLLVSAHWNIANSLLCGRFIRPTPQWLDLLLLVGVGALTALLTWRLGAISAAGAVLVLGTAYCGAALWLYVRWRIWVPMVLPVGAALLMQHVILVTYRVVFEEREKRRVRSFFAKVVSPNIVQELLRSEKLAFGGAQRDATVLFADVRGFTDLTDRNRETAERQIREKNLDSAAATALLDQQARDTLNTVNIYLAAVADVVKKHEGTLDKYIGDCVMAFWGSPTPNPRHAATAVQAAIEAQRAIAELNRQREAENQVRQAAGQPPLAQLSLGSGLNTGPVIVGLMGSDAHILNYTVFGREVNLASRLESVSGRGRIVVGETTFEHLRRDAPELAARCVRLAPTTVKGIREALVCYEVPWREADAAPVGPALSS
jgi:class 3 adenylate cyclase/CHASE2 domain-containing sensor protein